MNRLKVVFLLAILIAFGLNNLWRRESTKIVESSLNDTTNMQDGEDIPDENLHSLSIENLRRGNYPGSDITIEQTLDQGSNYNRYLTSYQSEGLKIYALLTVPNGPKPSRGWPVIIFNHGYIPPNQYVTTERYIAYVDVFARNDYIVFKSDYRGHGNSEGQGSSYGSNGYTIDVLNAVASMKKYKDADPNGIGMWGHSMGGHITLRAMVANKDIKAGVIWAGVVASYPDLINNWRRRTFTPPPGIPSRALGWRNQLTNQYGTPEENPEFWSSISANSYVGDISGPIQLHHAKDDSHVPFIFSEKLNKELQEANKPVEFYSYEGDDHNLTNSFDTAMQRSIEFFNRYLKGGESL